MSNSELTSRAHLITLNEDCIKFLRNNIKYPFIEIKCHGSEKSTEILPIGSLLSKKMFLFLEQTYLDEIKCLKSEMKKILNNQD
tara:strand:+ start:9 stop:260 length:252 start_codon:yes stop_codon:yes gene_type:complete